MPTLTPTGPTTFPGGPPGVWDEFDQKYAPLLRFWLRPCGLQRADIEDVIQDVQLVVLQRFADFHPANPNSFRAWLRTILSFRLKTHWRHLSRQRSLWSLDALRDGLQDPSGEPARHWDRDHDLHVMRGLLAKVRRHFHDTTWKAFWETAIEGRKPGEVAKELGVTPNVVFIARSRVMKRLRTTARGLVAAAD